MAGVEELGVVDTVPSKPLTKWANEPTVAKLKEDLLEATGDHDTHTSKVSAWLDNLNVTGGALITKVKGRSTIVPKLIRKQAEWRYASLSEPFLSTEDIYTTSPESWEDKDAAIQNGQVLNYQWNNKLNKVAFIDEYVRTAVDEGTVIVRMGWDFQEKEIEVPNMIPQLVDDPRQAQMILQAIQALELNPDQAQQELPPELLEDVQLTMQAGIPTEMVQDGMKTVMKTTKNQPTAEVCDYTSLIMDPTAKGDMDKATFVIFKFETSLSELRKKGLYHNLDAINVEKNAIENDDYAGNKEVTSFNFKDAPRKKFIAYEYWGFWDKNDNGTTEPIVGTWVGDTLIRMDDSPFPDEGLPFILVQYLPKRKANFGEPDGELLLDNQKISGAVTRGMMDMMGRAAVGQMGMRKDALDITNQRKYDNGQDYMFNAHIPDARVAFHTHTYPEIPGSAQFMLSLQQNEAEALTGVKAFHDGISGEGLGKSATAARSALDAASKRELGILRRLAAGVVTMGRKMAAMNAVFLEDEEIIRLTNEEIVQIKRDDLAGRIDIKLSISTAETDNAKAEELSFMLQTMGNTMPQPMSQIILEDIARLRKMPELAKKIKDFVPQPDPLEEQIKMLEIEKLRAEIRKLDSETLENTAEAGLDDAKAEETRSSTDLKDLEFVETESGVTQERNLEQDGAQARANLERDVVKEALKGGNESSGESSSTTP